ncbi:MAG: selenocysteine-specific translation elongation factor [bacterium]
MRHFIVGTAGHVDHGKTALIQALTGVDTDRLEEEHQRGISIVLGFAAYEPAGTENVQVGIVDVPGHERFIRTMVAGATGVDAALLVVAADEGVKPQTREHLEILSLLGVRRGLVALTKVDLIEDEEWIELVEEEVRDLLAPTFLADALIVPVSARTGEGLDELRAILDGILSDLSERSSGRGFRLPIDRSFSVKGIGTVITGSVWSGTARVGDPLELLPSGLKTRVREVQQHGRSVESTTPGTRTALALHNVTVEDASTGVWLVTPGTLEPTRTVDLELRHLDSAPGPIEHNQRVRVHHGTQETFGRLRVLGQEELPPGEEGYAQLHLEEPIVPAVGDRLLIRRYSPMRAIAGAVVLDTDPPRHRTHDEQALEQLMHRAEGDPLEVVQLMLGQAGLPGVPLEEAVQRSALMRDQLVEAAGEEGWEVVEDRLVDSPHLKRAAREEVKPRLEAVHRESPLKRGLSAEVLAAGLDLRAYPEVADRILQEALEEGLAERDPPFWRAPGFEIRFEGVRGQARVHLLSAARERGLEPWEREEAEEAARKAADDAGMSPKEAPDLLEALVHAGELVRYQGGFVLSAEGHRELVRRIRGHLEEEGSLKVSDFRDLSGGLTRKYAIPILEDLDSRGVTRREGDVRVPGPGH